MRETPMSGGRALGTAVLGALMVLAGCQPELGECDPDAARAPIYYDENGFPAYPGQALVEVSCGAGAFCHTQGIDPADRLGVPVGLDLDVAVAVEPGEVERLRHARDVAWALRHAIIEQVAVGSMPPPPPTGATALGAGARYRTTEGRELPSIDSPEARAILRSWLACGAPVVEATEGESQGVGDIVARLEPSSCQGGQTSCEGMCVDTSSDPASCGACGVACGVGQACVAGRCECQNGLAACGAECVDLATDRSHCGACGASCGDLFCAGGSCVGACPAGTTDCGGSCVDLATSLAHCGSCGEACGAGESCRSGRCSCAEGLTDCGAGCVDLARDPMSCGGCGIACLEGGQCVAGTCACPAGLDQCGGACVDTALDPAHCGACGQACAAGEGCAGGVCVGCGPEVSFARDVEPIFAGRCAGSGCHGGSRPAASLALTAGRAYAELVGVPASCGSAPLVTAGDVERSYLWNKLTGVGMCSGNQMPKRGESLSPSELELVRSWICRGAEND